MTRVWLAACAGLLTLAAGCGGKGPPAAGAEHVSVQIRVMNLGAGPGSRPVRSFTLTCNPTGGTLPLARRVCADIKRHPQAMLAPHWPRPRSTCLSFPAAPFAIVVASAGSVTTTFGGGGCFPDPSGIAGRIYLAAAEKNRDELAGAEPELPCDEGPDIALETTLRRTRYCMLGMLDLLVKK